MTARSLAQRLGLLQPLLAAALIVSFAGSAIWISARTLERQEKAFLDNAALRLAESLQQEWTEEHDLKRAAAAALAESAPPGVHVDVLDEQGRTVASTGTRTDRVLPDVREARRHVAAGAWILVSISTRARRDAVRALSLALLVAAVPLVLVASVAGRWLARRALRPLSRMAAQAERIPASGQVGPLGCPGDPAEVAALAGSFDRLVERLNDMVRAERHFAEDAAHELRTPLTVISGEIEFALSQPELGEREREGLQRASAQARAMTDLVEALLFLRHADNGREGDPADVSPVNLADLARDTVRALLQQHPGRAGDIVTDAEDEVLVAGQPVLLAAALRNMVSNALKFTRPGQAIRVLVKSCGDASEVVVEDAGPGVAPADRGSIFDPFYRGAEARASQEGFGLGLPILRRVARAHGGDVAVTSSGLGGARFELSLPAWMPERRA